MQTPRHRLVGLHFDPGTGAMFSLTHDDKTVRCFVAQDNGFLAGKVSPGQNFVDVFERYATLVEEAAALVLRDGATAPSAWGVEVTSEALHAAKAMRRTNRS